MPDPLMPQPENEDDSPRDARSRRDAVSAYVDRVEMAWLAAKLPSRDRRRLADELEDSLEAALAAGATPREIFEVDPSALAQEIADAEGIVSPTPGTRMPVDRSGLIRWGVGSAIAMAAVVWFFLLMPLAALFFNDGTRATLIASMGVLYGICAVLTVGAAATGMAHYLKGTVQASATVRLATISVTFAGAVGVAICLGLARLSNYSSEPPVFLTYVLTVGSLMSAGIAFAWDRRPASDGTERPFVRSGAVPR